MQRQDHTSLVEGDVTKQKGQLVGEEQHPESESLPPPEGLAMVQEAETLGGAGDGRSLDLGNFEWARAYLRLEVPCRATPAAMAAAYGCADAWVQKAAQADIAAMRALLIEGRPALGAIPDVQIPEGVLVGKMAFLECSLGLTVNMGDKMSRRMDVTVRVPFKFSSESLAKAHGYVRDMAAKRLQAKLENKE